jgi:hypothetical protein
MEEFESISPLSQQQHDSKDSDTPPKLRTGWAKTMFLLQKRPEGVRCVRSTRLQPKVSHPYSAAAAVPDSFLGVI